MVQNDEQLVHQCQTGSFGQLCVRRKRKVESDREIRQISFAVLMSLVDCRLFAAIYTETPRFEENARGTDQRMDGSTDLI